MKIYRKMSSESASTPAETSMFRKRPFTVETNLAEDQAKPHELPDLQTQLERGARFRQKLTQMKVHGNRPVVEPQPFFPQIQTQYENEPKFGQRPAPIPAAFNPQLVQRLEEETPVQAQEEIIGVQRQAAAPEEEEETAVQAQVETNLVQRMPATPEPEKSPVETLSFDALAPGTEQKILLLGEANFSFAKSLAQNLDGKGKGVVATSYESVDEIKKRYNAAKDNIQVAESQGAKIFHGIDAQNIDPNLGGPPPEFQFIVFNFPFVEGDRPGAPARNQQMLAKFMQSASKSLAKGGRIFVTSKQYWISRFHLDSAAEAAGLKWENKMNFDANKFPGYEHRETHDDKSAQGTEKAVTLTFTK